MLLSARDANEAVEQARTAWLGEREPDLRMAWATIVLEVQKRAATFDRRPCL